MEVESFMKITFIDGKSSKFNTYLQKPDWNISKLNSQITFCIFQQRKLQIDEIRIYWIDDDGDQIDIIDQQDYGVFRLKRREKPHLYVERVKKIPNESTSSTGNDSGAVNVHDKVQCDECHVAPIVGSRYKCLECENYDLCAKCEGKGMHCQHLMLRISSPFQGYWWAIKDFRKRAKRGSSGGASGSDDQCNSDGRRNHRKFANANRGSNLFTNLCEMMQNLAEGEANNVYKTGDRQDATATPPQTPPNEGEVAPPKTPPSTPTNVNLSEQPSLAQQNFEPETKSKEATTNTSPKTSQLGTPLIENPQHAQYMKAGIEILSNFSEMFSKMLQPVDASDGIRCPFDAALFTDQNSHSHSKSQSTSTDSGNEASFDVKKAHDAALEAAVKAQAAAMSSAEASVHAVTSAAAVAASSQQPSNMKPSQDVDGDWQMIDKTVRDLSASPSSVSIVSIESGTKPNSVDYGKLSQDLRKHLECNNEILKKGNEGEKSEVMTSASETETPSSENEVKTSSSSAVATPPVATPSSVSVTTSPIPTTSPAPINEEKRGVPVYHRDSRINNAVIAMMAMGFSNEGGWLTQLLESVNGNIPEALDEMSAAQRNRA